MAQHLLNGTEVGAIFQQMSGKGMAQGMRSNISLKASLTHIFFQYLPKPLPGQAAAVDVEEYSLLLAIAEELASALLQIAAYGFNCRLAHGHNALLRALSQAAQKTHFQVDVNDIQVH